MDDRLISVTRLFSKAFLGERETAFFLLCSLGINNHVSPQLWKEFQYLGAVHLLVLSGAHAKHFLGSINRLLAAVLPLGSVVPRACLLAGASFVYTAASAFSPALVRACLCFFLASFASHWSTQRLLGLAFLIQVFFFPEHLFRLGFYLSWGCFLLLLWMAQQSLSLVFRLSLLSLVSQAGVALWRPDVFLDFSHLPLIIVANGFLIAAMETFFLPYLGVLMVLLLGVSFLPAGFWPDATHILQLVFEAPLYFGAKIVSLAVGLFRTL